VRMSVNKKNAYGTKKHSLASLEFSTIHVRDLIEL
jgi:hypothetical protein